MPDILAIARALLCAALLRALTERLPRPPEPPPMDYYIDPRLFARWEALPAAGMDGARLLVVGDRARVISPALLEQYDRWTDAEFADDGVDDLGGIAGLYWQLAR